jgi:hypothetical protein
MELTENMAVIYTHSESMYATNFCGARAIDYCGIVSDNVCLALPASDLEDNLTGYDQFIRRLIWKSCISNKPLKLTFLIDSRNSNKDDSELTNFINDRISLISKDIADEVTLLNINLL